MDFPMKKMDGHIYQFTEKQKKEVMHMDIFVHKLLRKFKIC